MLDLTFLTSNTIKLAHARYIAHRLPIKIIGFRQRTYHASYFEPRVTSRSELLEKSYGNALDQCRKAGIPTQHQFFLLEDTSVRIDALSTSDNDVPGLDVKYWMEKISFAELDDALQLLGNDRRAQVRSDVLLHIPKLYRSVLGVTDDYCIFTGKQDGYVIDAEFDFESNIVFPWLNNQTFNKWFCPGDFKLPLGALDIGAADQVDFRRKAFEKVFTFLYGGRLFDETPIQMTLPLDDDVNFILCGYTGAGKTTASQHLARMYRYLHIEASDFMHLSYYYRHGYQPNVPISDFAERALVEIPHIVSEKVAEFILEEKSVPVVVSGFRSLCEVDWLLDNLKFTGKRFRVIFIEAEQETRFNRTTSRNRMDDGMSFNEFRTKDDQQRRMGLVDIREADGVEKWSNNRSLDAYLDLVESQVEDNNFVAKRIDIEIDRLEVLENVKLEDAILIALLSVWTTEETRAYLSTLEIARIINGQIFPHIHPKHRENVHRYFNQDFYAYYEIGTRNRGKARVYRLSNTGYGRALRSFRSLVEDEKEAQVRGSNMVVVRRNEEEWT